MNGGWDAAKIDRVVHMREIVSWLLIITMIKALYLCALAAVLL